MFHIFCGNLGRYFLCAQLFVFFCGSTKNALLQVQKRRKSGVRLNPSLNVNASGRVFSAGIATNTKPPLFSQLRKVDEISVKTRLYLGALWPPKWGCTLQSVDIWLHAPEELYLELLMNWWFVRQAVSTRLLIFQIEIYCHLPTESFRSYGAKISTS